MACESIRMGLLIMESGALMPRTDGVFIKTSPRDIDMLALGRKTRRMAMAGRSLQRPFIKAILLGTRKKASAY